jgi:hypothetical protein
MLDSELPLPVERKSATTPESVKDPNEIEYPGVELAYAIAVASYDSIVKRLDVMDGRIQTMLAFASTTTAVVPTVAKAAGLSFRSWWLYSALGLFALQLIIGTYARLVGTIRLLKPAAFYDRWLAKSPWTFKKDLIYFAGQDFNANGKLLQTRWRLTVAISVIFFLEVGLLLAWIAYHT